MGRQQRWVYHVEPEDFPQDFPERLEAFVEVAGLTWRGLARLLKVNARSVRRWKAGTRPGPGHLVSMFNLAADRGLLHILLPSAGEPESIETEEDAGGQG